MKKLKVLLFSGLFSLSFLTNTIIGVEQNITHCRSNIVQSGKNIYKKLKTPKGLLIAVPLLIISQQLLTNKPTNNFNYKKLSLKNPEQFWLFFKEKIVGCLGKKASFEPKLNKDTGKYTMELTKGQKPQGVIGNAVTFAVGSMKLPAKALGAIAVIGAGLNTLDNMLLSDLDISVAE